MAGGTRRPGPRRLDGRLFVAWPTRRSPASAGCDEGTHQVGFEQREGGMAVDRGKVGRPGLLALSLSWTAAHYSEGKGRSTPLSPPGGLSASCLLAPPPAHARRQQTPRSARLRAGLPVCSSKS